MIVEKWLRLYGELPDVTSTIEKVETGASADLVVVNKVDLASVMEVSVDSLTADVHKLKPDIKVIPTSCKTGIGLDELTSSLLAM